MHHIMQWECLSCKWETNYLTYEGLWSILLFYLKLTYILFICRSCLCCQEDGVYLFIHLYTFTHIRNVAMMNETQNIFIFHLLNVAGGQLQLHMPTLISYRYCCYMHTYIHVRAVVRGAPTCAEASKITSRACIFSLHVAESRRCNTHLQG